MCVPERPSDRSTIVDTTPACHSPTSASIDAGESPTRSRRPPSLRCVASRRSMRFYGLESDEGRRMRVVTRPDRVISMRTSPCRSVWKSRTPRARYRRNTRSWGWPKGLNSPAETTPTAGSTASRKVGVLDVFEPWWGTFSTSARRGIRDTNHRSPARSTSPANNTDDSPYERRTTRLPSLSDASPGRGRTISTRTSPMVRFHRCDTRWRRLPTASIRSISFLRCWDRSDPS